MSVPHKYITLRIGLKTAETCQCYLQIYGMTLRFRGPAIANCNQDICLIQNLWFHVTFKTSRNKVRFVRRDARRCACRAFAIGHIRQVTHGCIPRWFLNASIKRRFSMVSINAILRIPFHKGYLKKSHLAIKWLFYLI